MQSTARHGAGQPRAATRSKAKHSEESGATDSPAKHSEAKRSTAPVHEADRSKSSHSQAQRGQANHSEASPCNVMQSEAQRSEAMRRTAQAVNTTSKQCDAMRSGRQWSETIVAGTAATIVLTTHGTRCTDAGAAVLGPCIVQSLSLCLLRSVTVCVHDLDARVRAIHGRPPVVCVSPALS